jgi:hypothetical protein
MPSCATRLTDETASGWMAGADAVVTRLSRQQQTHFGKNDVRKMRETMPVVGSRLNRQRLGRDKYVTAGAPGMTMVTPSRCR